MSYYQRHAFFCTNQRRSSKKCCQNAGALDMCQYAKRRIKNLGLSGKGKFRVNISGCLGRCEQGPIIVIYPEGVWYSYQTKEDVDEIIDNHLVNNITVERLLLKNLD